MNRFLALAVTVALVGCGGGGGGGGSGDGNPPSLDDTLVYADNRDLVTGQIIPVLTESGSGYEAGAVDSPCVVFDSGRPLGDPYLLYYQAMSTGGVSTIGVVSSDEEEFDMFTVGRTQAIGLGAAGSGYSGGATNPTVWLDESVPFGMDGRYHIWFEGRSGPGGGTSTIIHATSENGVTWANFTSCTGLVPSFGTVRVADPTVVYDGDRFKMWFEAINTTAAGGGDGPGSIGYAESLGGIAWLVRDGAGNTGAFAGPVYVRGAAAAFDGDSVNAPSVVLDASFAPGVNGRFQMWYQAEDGGNSVENTIGFATSPDGLTWSNPQAPVARPSADNIMPLPFDSGDLQHPAAVINHAIPPGSLGHYLLYYAADSEGNTTPNRIGLRKGRRGP